MAGGADLIGLSRRRRPLSEELPLVALVGGAVDLFKNELTDRHAVSQLDGERPDVPDFELEAVAFEVLAHAEAGMDRRGGDVNA